MRVEKIPFSQISSLSFKDKFYQKNPELLQKFIHFTPDLVGLSNAIEIRKNNFPVDRNLLVEVLSDHYRKVTPSDVQKQNIDDLRYENAFTVVTAHQPSILGGPAYYFYKIYSTINLCRQLRTKFPQFRFVPVFVSGSEDHDFDEVKTLHLFNKNVEWSTEAKGPVGRFSNEGIEAVIQNVAEILGDSDNAQELISIFKDGLKSTNKYNDFVFYWLNQIFKDQGLLIFNMDDPRLKKAFIPHIKKEILEKKSIDFVQKAQDELAEFGFRPQAFPREINFFYMLEGLRERIYFENGKYLVNHTYYSFTEEELLQEIDNNPERFSPNVIMRPLYQESILPNIAYIGGGGEIAYWLERKTQFEYFSIFFPVLIRRNSVMLLTKSMQKALEKPGMQLNLILKEENLMISEYLAHATATDYHLTGEAEKLNHIFEEISERAKLIDPTLGPFVLSEGHKMIKSLEAIEARLKKSIKQKEETTINQLKNLRQKLLPDNGLQERKDSLIQYLSTEGKELHEKLIHYCDPLEKDFLFLYL